MSDVVLTYETEPQYPKSSNICDLCHGERRVGVSWGGEPRPECPWCRAVRLKHGSYWYPVDDSNRHLFRPLCPQS